jgi:hypothetical protein
VDSVLAGAWPCCFAGVAVGIVKVYKPESGGFAGRVAVVSSVGLMTYGRQFLRNLRADRALQFHSGLVIIHFG